MGQEDLEAEIPLDNDYLKTNGLSLGHPLTNDSLLKADIVRQCATEHIDKWGN
jgi:hypothetical protein